MKSNQSLFFIVFFMLITVSTVFAQNRTTSNPATKSTRSAQSATQTSTPVSAQSVRMGVKDPASVSGGTLSQQQSARIIQGKKAEKLRTMGPGSQSAVCSRYIDNCEKIYDEKSKKFISGTDESGEPIINTQCEEYVIECSKFLGITDETCVKKFDSCVNKLCNPEEMCMDFATTLELAQSCIKEQSGYYKYTCKAEQLKVAVRKKSALANSNSAIAKAESEAQIARAEAESLQAQMEQQKIESQRAIEEARVETQNKALAMAEEEQLDNEKPAEKKEEFSMSAEYDKCYKKYTTCGSQLEALENYTNCRVDGQSPRDKLQSNSDNYEALDLLSGVGNFKFITNDSCPTLPPRLKMTQLKVKDFTSAVNEYKTCVASALKLSQKNSKSTSDASVQTLNKLLSFLRTANVANTASKLSASNFASVKDAKFEIKGGNILLETRTSFNGGEFGTFSSGFDGREGANIVMISSMSSAKTLMNLTEFVNEEFEKYAGGSAVSIKIAQVQTKNCTSMTGDAWYHCIRDSAVDVQQQVLNSLNNYSVAKRNLDTLINIALTTSVKCDLAMWDQNFTAEDSADIIVQEPILVYLPTSPEFAEVSKAPTEAQKEERKKVRIEKAKVALRTSVQACVNSISTWTNSKLTDLNRQQTNTNNQQNNTNNPSSAPTGANPNAAGSIVSPVNKITEPFGARGGTHKAIDIDGQCGDDVYAVWEGTASLGQDTLSGLYIILKHTNGWTSSYSHLNARHISQGQTVAQGYKIGDLGNTGHCIAGKGGDGSHLHFKLRDATGKEVDPCGEGLLDCSKK